MTLGSSATNAYPICARKTVVYPFCAAEKSDLLACGEPKAWVSLIYSH